MPLLRYDTGDTAWLVQPAAPENRYRLRVNGIRSRWGQEFLVARNGAPVSIAALNMHSGKFSKVSSYQFYQDTQGEATIRVVPATLKRTEIVEFVDELQEKVGSGVRFRLDICDEIRLNSRGKRPLIEQKLDLRHFLEPADPHVVGERP
jgi:phenylacetate-CoA ligase